ncbi:MAG: hypothetical protein Q8K85_02910 [Hyphomicrobium sp.]|nr:hypothetical protein [Hyphomicrobium sp.]
MSHVARSSDFHGETIYSPALVTVPTRKSLLHRLFHAMMWSRERQSQRDVDRLVSWRDGGFNDSFEREIAERFYSDGWNFRR